MSLVRYRGASESLLPAGVAMIGSAAFYNSGDNQELPADGSLTPVLNDSLGARTLTTLMPVGVTVEWENPAGIIKFTGLEAGDQLMLTHRFAVTPEANEGLVTHRFDIGPFFDYHKQEMDRGAARMYWFNIEQHLVVNDSLIADGLKITINSTVPVAYKHRGVEMTIIKRNV